MTSAGAKRSEASDGDDDDAVAGRLSIGAWTSRSTGRPTAPSAELLMLPFRSEAVLAHALRSSSCLLMREALRLLRGAPVERRRSHRYVPRLETHGRAQAGLHPRRPPGPSCMGWLRRSDQVCAHCPFSKAWNRGLLGGVAVPSDPLQRRGRAGPDVPARSPRTAAGGVVGKVRMPTCCESCSIDVNRLARGGTIK